MYIFFWGPREGNACDDKRQGGLSVSPPDLKLWFYYFWLGKLRCTCPLHKQRAVTKNGIICSESRKTSSFERSLRKLSKQSFKAESRYGNLSFKKKNVIKILSMPSVPCILTTLPMQGSLQQKAVFSNAGCRKCVNRYGGLSRQHWTWLQCTNIRWNHSGVSIGITHSQKNKQMSNPSPFVWKPFCSIERGCHVMTQFLIKEKSCWWWNHWLIISGTWK